MSTDRDPLPAEAELVDLLQLVANWMPSAPRGTATLSPRHRFLAICVVAKLNNADRDFLHYVALLRDAGASDSQLRSLQDVLRAANNLGPFDTTERAVMGLALEMTRDVHVSASSLAAARAAFPEAQLLALITTVAAANMTTRVNVALGRVPHHKVNGQATWEHSRGA